MKALVVVSLNLEDQKKLGGGFASFGCEFASFDAMKTEVTRNMSNYEAIRPLFDELPNMLLTDTIPIEATDAEMIVFYSSVNGWFYREKDASGIFHQF